MEPLALTPEEDLDLRILFFAWIDNHGGGRLPDFVRYCRQFPLTSDHIQSGAKKLEKYSDCAFDLLWDRWDKRLYLAAAS
jgi:hypothetical protein